MTSTVVGFILAWVFTGYIIQHSIKDLRVLNDIPGFLLIVGSTVAMAYMANTAEEAKRIWKAMLDGFKKRVDRRQDIVREIVTVAKVTNGDPRLLEQQLGTIQQPFFKEGVGLILDRFKPDQIESIMSDRIDSHKHWLGKKTMGLKALAKYPPAFGIIACVVSLIAVMQKLGGELKAGDLGPSMAIGLVGTLIGLLASNFVIMPLGENTEARDKAELKEREIILQGVLLLANKETPLFVQEKLNSYLKEEQRVDVLGVGGGGKAA
jgi:chemotaxis protein MotA